MLKELGLEENCDYSSERVEIFHEPSKEWFPLLETRNKTVIYEDSEEKRRTAKAEKIGEVNLPDGEVNPVSLVKEKSGSEKVNLFGGILSNTNYEGQGVYVKHKDKGFRPLVRTSNKVLFIAEENSWDGEEKRMTLSKLVDVFGIEMTGDE